MSFKRTYRRTLLVADLSGHSLKNPGLNNDISAGDDYLPSQAWSRAVHEARPDIDGIRDVSRQHNTAFCYALFGRSGVQADGWAPLSEDDLWLLCRRFRARVI